MYNNPFDSSYSPKAKLPAGSYKNAKVTDIYDDGNIRIEKNDMVCTIPKRARRQRSLAYVTAEGHKAKTREEVESILESIKPHLTLVDITLVDEVSEKDGKTYANVTSAKFRQSK